MRLFKQNTLQLSKSIFLAFISILISGCYSNKDFKFIGNDYKYEIPSKYIRKMRGSLYGFPDSGLDDGSQSVSLTIPPENSEESTTELLSIMIFFDRDYSSDGGLIKSIERGKSLWPYKKINEVDGFFVYKHGSMKYKNYFTFDIDKTVIATEDDFEVQVSEAYKSEAIGHVFKASCKLHYNRDGLNISVSPLRGVDACESTNFRNIKKKIDDHLSAWRVY